MAANSHPQCITRAPVPTRTCLVNATPKEAAGGPVLRVSMPRLTTQGQSGQLRGLGVVDGSCAGGEWSTTYRGCAMRRTRRVLMLGVVACATTFALTPSPAAAGAPARGPLPVAAASARAAASGPGASDSALRTAMLATLDAGATGMIARVDDGHDVTRIGVGLARHRHSRSAGHRYRRVHDARSTGTERRHGKVRRHLRPTGDRLNPCGVPEVGAGRWPAPMGDPVTAGNSPYGRRRADTATARSTAR
jgi:hypothetical protein